MRTPSSAAFLLCLAVAAHANAPCDPNKRPESREDQLAAMTDQALRARSLSQVGLHQQSDGRWSYMNGGVITDAPMPRPVGQAYDLYCSYVAQAQAAARQTAAKRPAAVVPAEAVPASASQRQVSQDSPSRLAGIMDRLKKALPTTPTDADVVPASASRGLPPCERAVCVAVANCSESGYVAANGSGTNAYCNGNIRKRSQCGECPAD